VLLIFPLPLHIVPLLKINPVGRSLQQIAEMG
jgi:hypothetical protein